MKNSTTKLFCIFTLFIFLISPSVNNIIAQNKIKKQAEPKTSVELPIQGNIPNGWQLIENNIFRFAFPPGKVIVEKENGIKPSIIHSISFNGFVYQISIKRVANADDKYANLFEPDFESNYRKLYEEDGDLLLEMKKTASNRYYIKNRIRTVADDGLPIRMFNYTNLFIINGCFILITINTKFDNNPLEAKKALRILTDTFALDEYAAKRIQESL